MLKVTGWTKCLDVVVARDPWIPLDVCWTLGRRSETLYLLITGVDGGYIEAKVDSETGALVEILIIDEPPHSKGYEILPDGCDSACLTAVLDLNMWTWKATPDYIEPDKRISRTTSKLGLCVSRDIFTLKVALEEPAQFIGDGSVRFGITADGELSCLVGAVT